MNGKRFNELKNDLSQAFSSIGQEYPNTRDFVNKVCLDLGVKYSELPPSSNQQEPQQKQTAEKRKEDVAKELNLNLNSTRFKDYQNIEDSLKRNNPQQCIESVNLLSKVIGDSRKKIVYYSALQGELLKAVKESTSSYTFSSLLH